MQEAPRLGLQLRAGLHTGECEIVDDDGSMARGAALERFFQCSIDGKQRTTSFEHFDPVARKLGA